MAKKQADAKLCPYGDFKREPTTRELLAKAIEARQVARAKIDGQAKDRAARKGVAAKAAKRHKPGTSEYYRAIAEEQRKSKAVA